MKKLNFAGLFILLSLNIAAQSANLGISSLMVPSTVAVNNSGILMVDVDNGGDLNVTAGCAVVTISIPSTISEITGVNAGTDGVWTTTITSFPVSSIIFRNTGGPIIGGYANSYPIHLNVKGTTPGGNPGNINTNVRLALSFEQGGCTALGNQFTADDNSPTSITVTAVLAVSLTDVTSTASDCSAKIAWSTVREDAGSTFDIEYSPDGARFVKVGTVAGRSATGANYEYSYNQGDGKGFYRLKIGASTGGVTYSKVVNVTTKCNEKKVFIYPNPIQNEQELHINVSNFVGKVKGDLMNAVGQVILTKALVNGPNTLKIVNLAEGIYTFKVADDAKEIQNFKIVVVK